MWQGWAVGSLLWLCVSCADGFIDGCIIMNFTQLFKIAPMTLLFIISFVVVMGIQLIQGVNIDEQTGQELIDYGANFLPLTLTDEPWRLVTAGFLHIGVIHLLFNSFAIYYFGMASEQILGWWRFLVVFLLSVVAGNLLNLYTTLRHIEEQGVQGIGLSAGASGGIMGLGMLLLTLSMFNLNKKWRLNTKNLASVMGINFVMTFAIPGIDVAGHIGGMMMGMVLGLCHVMSCRLNKNAHRGSECVVWGVFALCILVSVIVMMGAWQMMHGMVMRW